MSRNDAPSRTNPWTLWAEQRPTDTRAAYRWRIPERMILGAMLRPEWTAELRLCGMGYADSEWWPAGSHWDGYNRTVPAGLEWRLAEADETETVWGGLDLLPDPWTGKPPRVEVSTRYVAAPCWQAKSFSIKHRFGGLGPHWENVPAMVRAWNTRIPAQDSTPNPNQGSEE